MVKIICYDEEARHAPERGINQLANTVKITVGPKGRNVVLDKRSGAPLITNDGVAIAKEVEPDDPFEDMGAQLVREVSTKTNGVADDGTTTATLLTQVIIREGLENLAVGVNPTVMRRGIAKATIAVVKAIKANSKKVDDSASIIRMSTVSPNDEAVGKLIAEAVEKVSHDGVIIVEESKTTETYSEAVKGMQFDRGYITPYTVTDTEEMEAVPDDALILIIDKKIPNIRELLPILEQVVQSGKKLLVVAEDMEGEALSILIVNKLRGTLNVVCAKASSFGNRRKEMLENIATLTGDTAITPDMGYELRGVTMNMLGRTRRVKVSKENAVIVDGVGSTDAIKARVNQIKSQTGTTASDYDRGKLQERLAKMAGDVAIIRVGVVIGIEMKEKKLRIEDALSATRAAIGENIMVGGGTAYVNAIASVEKLLAEIEGDEKVGVSIIVKTLTEPMHQIAIDIGIDGSIVLEDVKKANKVDYGFDACDETYVDMIFASVVDLTRVARSALENTISIAATLLTTESLVADKPQPSAPAAPAAPDMGNTY